MPPASMSKSLPTRPMPALEPAPFPFLSLPPELRLKIYDIYLDQTIIRIPGPPLPNTLDLLATCRLIHNEASSQVISKATFSVWCTEELLYFLSSLPDDKLRALRHAAVWASPVGFYLDYPSRPFFTTHFLTDVLCYFPGLQLETLAIRDGFHGPRIAEDGWGSEVPYRDVEQLVMKGKGWKELRYYTPCTAILDRAKEDQPKNWNLELRRRDGRGSGADVSILVAKELFPYRHDDEGYVGDGTEEEDNEENGAEGEVEGGPSETKEGLDYHIDISEINWEYVDESLPWREDDFTCFSDMDAVPKPVPHDQPRRIVVVVRRGRDSSVVEDGEHMKEKLKGLVERYGWRKMKEKAIMLSGHDDTTAML